MLRADTSPIVIFVWFRETKDSLCEQFLQHFNGSTKIKCASITGDITKATQRQQIVDSFQRGEIDILILTYGVGSTGITLTRSHRVVLLDRPWTPGDVRQAEDRVRRIGQTAPEVTSTWVSGFSYDNQLDLLLQGKEKRSNQVISGKLCSLISLNCSVSR